MYSNLPKKGIRGLKLRMPFFCGMRKTEFYVNLTPMKFIFLDKI